MKGIVILVRRLDTRLTAWLSRMDLPEMCFVLGEGLLTTHFLTEQYPEYCKVAPSNESYTDPRKPPKQPITMTGHCGVITVILRTANIDTNDK